MTGTIIPLGLKRDGASGLAGFDALAADLLAEGRATTLSMAQFDAILMKLQGQRAKLAAIIADLEMRAPSGDGRIAAFNATLSVEARKGLAQIELLIHQSEAGALATRRGSRPA